MHKPAPRVCSPKTSTAGSSTGTLDPTRSLCSQYANWHQQVDVRSLKIIKYKHCNHNFILQYSIDENANFYALMKNATLQYEYLSWR